MRRDAMRRNGSYHRCRTAFDVIPTDQAARPGQGAAERMEEAARRLQLEWGALQQIFAEWEEG
jgi:hypothetical protein